MTDYKNDFALWLDEQANLLRQRAINALDWENLAEEIEAVGRSEKHEVYSRLRRICQHLLKWQYQPEHRARSWRVTLNVQRDDLAEVISDSPSLRGYAADVLARAYARGRRDAEDETGLLNLPAECPWTIEQVLDIDFLPD